MVEIDRGMYLYDLNKFGGITMDIGMLWFFDSKKLGLEQAVRQALDYYQKKYGKAPNRCFTNITSLEAEMDVNGVKVVPMKYILLNHLWIGVEKTDVK